jgi:hypothetical protein
MSTDATICRRSANVCACATCACATCAGPSRTYGREESGTARPAGCRCAEPCTCGVA